ncbi:MAG: hypothetical protein ACTHMU_25475 [Thermomicrobiales bacterium]
MKRGYRWLVAALTLAVYLGSSLPYLFGYWRQTATQRFTGIVFDVVDTAQYFAWMRAFAERPLIANPLTPEPGAHRFFNLQWWLLGQLAYRTPLGPTATYQILRVVALLAFVAALVVFCERTVRSQRALAFALTLTSSGLGWLLVLIKYARGDAELRWPLAVQIGEPNTFFSAMAFPHLLVAGALSLAIFWAFLRALDTSGWPRRRWLALACILTIALGLSHGYDLIPVIVIPGVTALALAWRNRRVRALWPPAPAIWAAAAITLAALPPALYSLSLTRLDATWRGVLAQYGNAGVFTPAPPQLLILFGVPFPLALWQLRPAAWRTSDAGQLFLRVWFSIGFALLYVPTNYQVKMLTAYQVPVCLLAAQTLAALGAWLRPRLSRTTLPLLPRVPGAAPALLAVALIAGVSLTNLYLAGWRAIDLQRTEYPYYLSAGDVQALTTIGTVAQPGQVVLSSPNLGVFVPVYSDARPFVAHWAQTLDFFARRDLAARVYAATLPDDKRRQLIADNGITFVLAGPAEAAFADEAAPPRFALPLVPDGADGTPVYRAEPALGAAR